MESFDLPLLRRHRPHEIAAAAIHVASLLLRLNLQQSLPLNPPVNLQQSLQLNPPVNLPQSLQLNPPVNPQQSLPLSQPSSAPLNSVSLQQQSLPLGPEPPPAAPDAGLIKGEGRGKEGRGGRGG